MSTSKRAHYPCSLYRQSLGAKGPDTAAACLCMHLPRREFKAEVMQESFPQETDSAQMFLRSKQVSCINSNAAASREPEFFKCVCRPGCVRQTEQQEAAMQNHLTRL